MLLGSERTPLNCVENANVSSQNRMGYWFFCTFVLIDQSVYQIKILKIQFLYSRFIYDMQHKYDVRTIDWDAGKPILIYTILD